MDEYESLSHTKWECKYHIVFIPKCRRKTLFGQIRQHLGEVFHKLAAQKESRIEEGHLRPDHVHMLISIPPKYAVSQVVGLSRERARSTSPVCTEKGNEILLARASGLAGFSSLPWGVTRP
jgi:putative transposase